MAAPTNAAVRALGWNEAMARMAAALLTGLNFDGTAFTLPVNVEIGGAASTATLSNVNDGVSSVTLLVANAARLGFSIFNDSTSDLYVKYGSTASATSFSVKILAGGYYESPAGPIYTGIITGIWTADSTGAARMTELSA